MASLNCTLADLYDPLTMPPDLRAAHEANDRAVLAAYGLAPNTPEPEIVAHLFKLYADKTKELKFPNIGYPKYGIILATDF